MTLRDLKICFTSIDVKQIFKSTTSIAIITGQNVQQANGKFNSFAPHRNPFSETGTRTKAQLPQRLHD